MMIVKSQIDKRGAIIASTDTSRVGTFHSGAAKMIAEDLDELRIYENDIYAGARPGTTCIASTSTPRQNVTARR